LVSHANDRQAAVIEPTTEAETAWGQTMRDTAVQNLQFRIDCTPGYYNGEGAAARREGLFDGLYGPGPVVFYDMVRQWRTEGGMEGLSFS